MWNKWYRILILMLLVSESMQIAAQSYVWARQTGSANASDEIYPFTHTVDGSNSVISCGAFSGTMDFNPGPGVANLSTNSMVYDAYIQKLDAAGNFLWAASLQGNGIILIHSVKTDANGAIFLCGTFDTPTDFNPGAAVNVVSPQGSEDGFLLKLNASGVFQWVKTFGSPLASSTTPLAMAIDANNGNEIVLTGYFSDSTDFDPGPAVNTFNSLGFADGFILRLNSAGNFMWAKTLQTVDYMNPSELNLDGGSSILIGGTFQGNVDMDPGPSVDYLNSGNSEDVFVLKLNSAGNFQWSNQLGNNNYESLNGLVTDNTGHVYVALSFSDSLDADPGAGVSMVYSQGYNDVLLAKFTPGGAFQWAKGIGGSGFDDPKGLCIDGGNTLFLTGTFEASCDLDPGASVQNLNSNGDYDLFVARYDAWGNYLFARQVGGSGADASLHLEVDNLGNLICSGQFWGTVDFDPNAATVNLTAQSMISDAVVFKWGTCNQSITPLTAYHCNTYTLNGQTYTATGLYTQIFPGAGGCDSIVQLDLTIGSTNTTINHIQCGGGSYSLNGQTYTAPGNYTQFYTNAAGCDSNFYINLSFGTPNSSSQSATACDFYFFGNQMLNTSGIYTETFTNASGCDSVVTLNLTINNSVYSYSQISNCGPLTIGGQTYTTTGFYSQFYTSAQGCDSVIDLDLIINDPSSSTQTQTACKDYTFNGQTITASGTYTAVFPNSVGCDSTVTLNLTVISPNINVTQNGPILSSGAGTPASYQWIDCATNTAISGATGQTYTATTNGSYAVLVTLNGCSDTSICYPVTGIGFNEINEFSFLIYPNPVNDLIRIDLPDKEVTEVRIQTMQGQVLYQTNSSSASTLHIPCGHWAKGVYIAQINLNGKKYTQKLIKE